MNRWVALYMAASSHLGDENLADGLLLRAHTERDLERQLAAWGALPDPLPVPDPAVIAHVTQLRRRAERRRLIMKTWVAVVAVATLALGSLGATALRSPGERPEAVYHEPALVESQNDGQHFVIHRALADEKGVTIWWSVTGDGVGRGLPDPTFQWVQPTRRESLPLAVTRMDAGGGLRGTVVVDLIPTKPLRMDLRVGVGDVAHWVAVEPDRSALTALEQQVSANYLVSWSGVGVEVGTVVRSPWYTTVALKAWSNPKEPIRLSSAPTIARAEVEGDGRSGSHLRWLPGLLGEALEPIPTDARRLTLHLAPLNASSALQMPLMAGTVESLTGVSIGAVESGPEGARVSIRCARGVVYSPIPSCVTQAMKVRVIDGNDLVIGETWLDTIPPDDLPEQVWVEVPMPPDQDLSRYRVILDELLFLPHDPIVIEL